MSQNKINQIKETIDDIKNKMVDNIDKILANGEKMDNLVDTTGQMVEDSEQYFKRSNNLKWKMRFRLIIAIIVIVMIFVIIIGIVVGILVGALTK